MNDFHPRACEDRVYLNPRQVLAIYLSQGGQCLYCPTHLSPSNLTVEHVIPRYWGGPSTALWNLGLACRSCNDLKGTLEGGADIPDLGRTPEQRLVVILQDITRRAATNGIIRDMLREIQKRLQLQDQYHHSHLPDDVELEGEAALVGQVLAKE